MSGADQSPDMSAVHGLTTILQSIDVGLVVLDREWRVTMWNGFMENHSGIRSSHVMGRDLFEAFPDLPDAPDEKTVFLKLRELRNDW